MLDDIMSGKCIPEIQKLIDVEKTLIKMEETLDSKLNHVDGKGIIKDIKKFNNTIKEDLNVYLNNNIFIGITLHIACMIDRIMDNQPGDEFENKETYIKENMELYKAVKNACTPLNTKYSIIIPDDEICRIMTFLKEGSTIK